MAYFFHKYNLPSTQAMHSLKLADKHWHPLYGAISYSVFILAQNIFTFAHFLVDKDVTE